MRVMTAALSIRRDLVFQFTYLKSNFISNLTLRGFNVIHIIIVNFTTKTVHFPIIGNVKTRIYCYDDFRLNDSLSR